MQHIDPSPFSEDAVSDETRAVNAAVLAMFEASPQWWDVGAAVYRKGRAEGAYGFPAVVRLPRARDIVIPGAGGDEPIRLRVLTPESGAPRGVLLHIHGGGWVLGGADMQDLYLAGIADATGFVCVSVEYRLAPEHPYPAAPDDCERAALWLIERAKAQFGAETLTIGGESAGAHLAALTLLRLRDKHGFTGFSGANMVFGAYDLALTPSALAFGDKRLVLRTIDVANYAKAFAPDAPDRRAPYISPLYADLKGLCPALFTVGTRDALLDDTLFMHARWIAAGNDATLKIYPGGAHGFISFPSTLANAALGDMNKFLRGCAN